MVHPSLKWRVVFGRERLSQILPKKYKTINGLIFQVFFQFADSGNKVFLGMLKFNKCAPKGTKSEVLNLQRYQSILQRIDLTSIAIPFNHKFFPANKHVLFNRGGKMVKLLYHIIDYIL